VLIGGPGNDYIDGGFDDDFIVGDNVSLRGNAIGHVGKDFLEGEFGADRIVGDNFSRHNARGGVHDKIRGQKGKDFFVGDSMVTGGGTARGGATTPAAAAPGATGRASASTSSGSRSRHKPRLSPAPSGFRIRRSRPIDLESDVQA
jgi:hypothetical protein